MPTISSTIKHCYHSASANAIQKEETETYQLKEVELSLLTDEIIIYLTDPKNHGKLLKTTRI